jgi:hypothetical protein
MPPIKNPISHLAKRSTIKDFLNNNPIKWENFLGIQLNPIELREEEKESMFRSYS